MKKLLITLLSIGMIGVAQAQDTSTVKFTTNIATIIQELGDNQMELTSTLLRKHRSEKISFILSSAGSTLVLTAPFTGPAAIFLGGTASIAGIVVYFDGRVRYKRDLDRLFDKSYKLTQAISLERYLFKNRSNH